MNKQALSGIESSDDDILEEVGETEMEEQTAETVEQETTEEEEESLLEEMIAEELRKDSMMEGERVDIEQEKMYMRDGHLFWPKIEFKDREKIPRSRIRFVPAERFNHYGWHHLLRTYVPFGCDLSRMKLLSLRGIEFLWFLSYVDASENMLRTHTLGYLVHLRDLVAIKLDNNQIDSIILPYTLGELMYLDLGYNLIEKIPARLVPSLATLRLDSNKIKKVTNLNKKYFPKLVFLSISCNEIDSLKHSWTNNLVCLYIGYNNIRSLEGLEGLFKLRVLHLRGNLITGVAKLSTDLISLEYLNLRDNQIFDLTWIDHLAKFEFLSELIISDNPFTSHPNMESLYKNEIIKCLKQLTRLDKQHICDGLRSQMENPDLYDKEEDKDNLSKPEEATEPIPEELDSDDASEQSPHDQ